MKKVLFLMTLCLALSCIQAQNPAPLQGVEISFTYNRQGSFASNQFAVWIEDGGGNYIKTLFATRYTASGGWERRPLSIPIWVKKSGLSAMRKTEIDAFSGATPRTGVLRYRWDGTDKNGKAAAGEYRIFLEATLRNENGVLYSAPVNIGGGGAAGGNVEATVKTEYSGNSDKERGMIENVKVFYRP